MFVHISPRPGSQYRQYFVNETHLRAETIFNQLFGEDRRAPDQIAQDFSIPLPAVLECIRYCKENSELLSEEREADLANMRERGLDGQPASTPKIPLAS